MLVDTHCHLDFERFDADRDAVVARALEQGVEAIIVPGIDLETSRHAIALAEQYDSVRAAVGIHPNSVQQMLSRGTALHHALDTLQTLAEHPRVVAIGEIGLDYYRTHTPPAQQRLWFGAQLRLANTLGLPVILHNRDSSDDILAELGQWVAGGLHQLLKERPGVLHSFSAGRAEAARAIEMGFYLGFTGPLTYPNAEELRAVAGAVPAGRVLIETDAPFLAPQQKRGARNEPAYVRFVVERLAQVRGLSFEEVCRLTTANARQLFKL